MRDEKTEKPDHQGQKDQDHSDELAEKLNNPEVHVPTTDLNRTPF